MKHLPLISPQYQQMTESYREWLKTLGYAESTQRSDPALLREFFHYMEQKGKTTIEVIKAEDITDYIEYLSKRKNSRRSGALSISHINSHIDNLHKLGRYLKQSQEINLPVSIQRMKEEKLNQRQVLSIPEIESLYRATEESPVGLRDRAMLTVYYGCGLRKSEGVNLDVSDVLFERRLLYVRKTKNNYERYVPLTKAGITDLENYLYQSRPLLENETNKSQAFFLSERGSRINPESMSKRLEALKEKTADPVLQQKTFGLHVLRHSIATHLLQKGMELENIALFLGHKTLDSTQLYTHLLNEV